LRASSVAGVSAFLSLRCLAKTAPKASVTDIRVISHQPEYYHGWPTLARRRNGQLLLAWSGGRDGHVCPFGRLEMMASNDDGASWSWPQVLLDSPMDDRDAGIIETAKGTLLATTFTSLAYESRLKAARDRKPGEKGAWPAEKLAAWNAGHDRLSEEERRAGLGEWLTRSTDGGMTWSARIPTIVNSPHGPIQLKDGRLLYPGKELWTQEKRTGVCESSDDGQTWKWLAEIPTRPGDDVQQYHELHGVEAANGRIIVHIRNHNKNNERETLQSESADGGRTWSKPQAIGVWGVPSFLLRLRDGRLLMTYGHRRPPLGNQARVSEDHGRTWSEPMIISDDATSADVGYPSTVELADGSLLTAWYELMKNMPKAVLRQAKWKIV
jgi:sialidase-1